MLRYLLTYLLTYPYRENLSFLFKLFPMHPRIFLYFSSFFFGGGGLRTQFPPLGFALDLR